MGQLSLGTCLFMLIPTITFVALGSVFVERKPKVVYGGSGEKIERNANFLEKSAWIATVVAAAVAAAKFFIDL